MIVNSVLRDWNALDPRAAAMTILPCCGSMAWAEALAAERPLVEEQTLLTASAIAWSRLSEADWQEAFESHPRIGESKPQGTATAGALAWSTAEQSTAMDSEESERKALRDGNARYEQRFGRIFILRARGRSSSEVVAELEHRLLNSLRTELVEAAQQQSQITDLRLRQWLAGT